MRAAPARPFGPFFINPEFIGAPVRKPIVPPYADEQTIASLAPPGSGVAFGRYGYTLPQALPPVHSAHPLAPPSPVQSIFRSVSQQRTARANNAIASARNAAVAASVAQQAAAAAAYEADKAQAHAAMNPHPVVQQAATQATAKANLLANHARVLATTASIQDAQAQTAAAQDTSSPLTNSGYQNAGDPGSVYDDGTQGGPAGDLTPDPGSGAQLLPSGANDLIPGVTTGGLVSMAPVSGGLVADHPYATAAGAAGVGFLVGGPIGALIGLVAGGGYAYRQAQAAAQAPVVMENTPAVLPSGGAAAMSSLRGYRW